MTDKCLSKLSIIGPDIGLLPGRHQAIIWTSSGILLILTLGINFSKILSDFIQENAFENVVCDMAAFLSWPKCVMVKPR